MSIRSVKRILGLMILLELSVSINEGNAMTSEKWFESKVCKQLEIKKYKSVAVHEVVKLVRINDFKAIVKLMDRIGKLPANGDEMMSFGAKAEMITLSFTCDRGVQTVEIYEKQFKTPSTGFNTGDNPIQNQLYADIDALLYPDFHKVMLKIENLEIKYKDFTITYSGSKTKDGAPATLSLNTAHYSIKDKKNATQSIAIVSGQRPPEPQKIVVNRKKMTLFTYETAKNLRLYPDYFQIVH